MAEDIVDIAIVGGGPAGLQAALKTALLNFTGALFDKGQRIGRAYWAHRMVNIPGFPEGISGKDLLARQWGALEPWKHRVALHPETEVVAVDRAGTRSRPTYVLTAAPTKRARSLVEAPRSVVRSRAVIIATGVVDAQPLIGGKMTAIYPYANTGLLDYCNICDGYTMAGKRMAVIGHTAYGARAALELFHFGATEVTLFPNRKGLFEGEKVPPAEARELRRGLLKAGVRVVKGPIDAIGGYKEGRLELTVGGATSVFDKGFVAIGWHLMNTRLATELGGTVDPAGYVVTDAECRVLDRRGRPIPGLYSIGDVRNNWNQIPVLWGDAEQAVLHAYASYL